MNLKNLERTVEDDYISNLRNNCWKEKQQSTFARKTNCADLFLYLFEYWLLILPLSVLVKTIASIFWLPLTHLSWTVSVAFLQRKACYTELAILETLTCTKERRGLAHRAVPSCPSSQRHYTVEAAFMLKSKFSRLTSLPHFIAATCTICCLHSLFSCFVFFSSSPGFQNQHRILAVNRRALTIWRLQTSKQHQSCIKLTTQAGWNYKF